MLTGQNKVYTVVNETLGEDFDPIIDVAKNLAAEIDRVAAIHGQVEQENAFASVPIVFSEISLMQI